MKTEIVSNLATLILFILNSTYCFLAFKHLLFYVLYSFIYLCSGKEKFDYNLY